MQHAHSQQLAAMQQAHSQELHAMRVAMAKQSERVKSMQAELEPCLHMLYGHCVLFAVISVASGSS